jgi:predicted RNase H-like nuclease
MDQFLGIDFGWNGKPSGLAALGWDGQVLELQDSRRRTGVAEILSWVEEFSTPSSTLISIDAPLIITNQAGMRSVERILQREFGKYHAGPYPANLGCTFAARNLGLCSSLLEKGFAHGCCMAPKSRGRHQIEVFPHPAIVNLFGLDRTIKYKKGRLSTRRAELQRYRDLTNEVLSRLTPSLGSPRLGEVPSTGVHMKEYEDRLDAILCAFIGAHWWYWGHDRNQVFGDAEAGYVVVPNRYHSRA